MSEGRVILLADDHPMVRDSLSRVLAAAVPGTNCVEVATWSACLERLSDPAVAMALVDLNMPDLDVLQGVRAVRSLRPDVLLVAVSGQNEPRLVREVLALGARGFIPKTEPPPVIRHALALIWAGGTYIPSTGLSAEAAEPPAGAAPQGSDLAMLTPRQVQVLRCLARGLPNKLIANELEVSEGTAKIHIAAIMRVLRVRNRTEAVVRARELGLG